MKAMLSVLLALVVILLPITVTYAEEAVETEDSANVSDVYRRLLGVSEEATVIRMYNTHVIGGFSDFDTIEAVLANSKMQIIYYVVMPDGTVKELTVSEGIVYETNASVVRSQAMEVYKNGSVLDLIGEEVTVQNVYYLTGESSHSGTAIYYRTDKGDFVYYIQTNLGECFFPVETFNQLMDQIVEEQSKNGNSNIGMGIIGEWDVSSFQIGSPTFNLNAQLPGTDDQPQNNSLWLWIGIAAVVAAAAAGGGVVIWKKRKTA